MGGADREGHQISGSTLGFVRAKRPRAQSALVWRVQIDSNLGVHKTKQQNFISLPYSFKQSNATTFIANTQSVLGRNRLEPRFIPQSIINNHQAHLISKCYSLMGCCFRNTLCNTSYYFITFSLHHIYQIWCHAKEILVFSRASSRSDQWCGSDDDDTVAG